MMLDMAEVMPSERKGIFCLIVKKERKETAKMSERFSGHEIVLALDTADERNRWLEILDACAQKAHTQTMVKRCPGPSLSPPVVVHSISFLFCLF